MKTINDIDITDEYLKNEKYSFQLVLTKKLDSISSDFNQEIINEIVLWKVNRYTELEIDTLLLLNTIRKDDEILNTSLTKQILEQLLITKGIQLPMASTILRFKNPKLYQIIDQRVFRFIYGENMPKYFGSIESQIVLYLEYLEKLKNICEEKQINFELSDRIIYELDKEYNKDEKIKY
ncbi:hypothetical protein [Sediminibacterium salmoneum]|uniref:hypothetical protein n=1 Tax=Sediminibacterium salmoneum TaxID=426421 RepID=UPI0005635D5D|nr:hypothetical protein [Sediminibacterium salmoneum]